MQQPAGPLADTLMVEPVPIVIAETGHRDLQAAELEPLRRRVGEFLRGLMQRHPHLPLVLLTSLAEGAGRLVAHEARRLGLRLVVVLPVPAHLYQDDFSSEASRREFASLCDGAEVFELPLAPGNALADIARPGPARDRQYAQLGVFLSSHCQILLALWDGRPSRALGGTAQVVEFHLTGVMPGFVDSDSRIQQVLADDESDLIYHIVCSRDREGGTPAEGVHALESCWLTSDVEQPRTASLTPKYAAVLDRMAEFNRDVTRHGGRISTESASLLPREGMAAYSATTRVIDDLFRGADWLAIHFRQRVHWALRATYSIAVLMGLAFILYSDLLPQPSLIFIFLLLFALGLLLYSTAGKGDWHRKYLDYRALAEGLRVQFYWELAGVQRRSATEFAHDNFLQKQDVELGWIRNVMRWADLRRDTVGPHGGSEGLKFAIDSWVGSMPACGQLAYYAVKAAERTRLHLWTERLGLACLWTGIGVAALLGFGHSTLPASSQNLLVVLMGILPLLAAVREAYAHKRADKELIKQYRFMQRLFALARRRLDTAQTDDARREILRALGEACLDEHAEWILMHRERPLEHSRL